jgi:hypothetical protein
MSEGNIIQQADNYQELTEAEFNSATEFFIKKDNGKYEKITKTDDHKYENGKYFKEKDQQPALSPSSEKPEITSEMEDTVLRLTEATLDRLERKKDLEPPPPAAVETTLTPAGTNSASKDQPQLQPPAAVKGGRRTKRKQQKKGGKSSKKHRKSYGNKSRRSSSKKSRRQGRK